jgi:hypothetical protein
LRFASKKGVGVLLKCPELQPKNGVSFQPTYRGWHPKKSVSVLEKCQGCQPKNCISVQKKCRGWHRKNCLSDLECVEACSQKMASVCTLSVKGGTGKRASVSS